MGIATYSDLFQPSTEFTERKFAEHLPYNRVMFLVMAPYLVCMWGWDLTLDPVGAHEVLWLRLTLGALIAATGWLIGWRRVSILRRMWLVAIASTVSLALYTLICSRLAQGYTYGVGAFVFVQMSGFLLWTGFPFAAIVWLHLVGAALPQVLGMVLPGPPFPHLQYGVLVWPTTSLALAAQYMIHMDYLSKVALRHRLVEMASLDSLTGVMNRRTFMTEGTERLARCAAQGLSVSVLFIDADHFKDINDKHGHAVGDRVLMRLGEVVRAQLRRDDLCCRWGGEEFVVLICGSDELDGARVAQRTLQAIREARVSDDGGAPLHFTASIGMARGLASAVRLDALIDRADAAMYAAKTQGRDRVALA